MQQILTVSCPIIYCLSPEMIVVKRPALVKAVSIFKGMSPLTFENGEPTSRTDITPETPEMRPR